MIAMAQAFLDAMAQPALLVAPDRRIAAINAPGIAMLGYDLTGRHHVTALRNPSVDELIERSLSAGQPGTGRFVTTDQGQDIVWQVETRRLDGAAAGHVLVQFLDLTAVEAAGQMRRDFVANVSHELRTPLTALIGYIETLQTTARDDPAARDRFLATMQRESGRMARLIDDLLSLSRVEAQERQRPTEPVDLCGLAQSVANDFASQAAARQTTIRIDRPDTPVIVPGDPGQLRQVLNNLVENALKYGGTGKTVTVTVSGPVHSPRLRTLACELSVTDEGDGIPAHHIPRLTERFYRVDSHRSREVGGTGLGLAIVKHIATRHRGRLSIDSTLGLGSRFTLHLPAA